MQFYANDNEETLEPQEGDCPKEAAHSWVWDYGPDESFRLTVGWGLTEDNLIEHVVEYWVEIDEEDPERFTLRLQEPPPNAGFISKSYRLAAEMDAKATATGSVDRSKGDPSP